MKIISYNLNGIRAAIKKGLIEWLTSSQADIICLQETKATPTDIDTAPINALGYHDYWFTAEKKGYSGVAVFTKTKPINVVYGNGFETSDKEGRVIRLDFEAFTLINAYFPSGTSGEERQAYKYVWLAEFEGYIKALREEKPNLVVTGDYNIAHRPIDIHDPVGNKKSSGFLPQEREWMDKFLELGFIDTFRHLHPNETGAYSWWSVRSPTVRAQNKGWRIDYITTTKSLEQNNISAQILPDIKHSDHCPISLDLGF